MNTELYRIRIRNSAAKRRLFMFGGEKLVLESEVLCCGRISTPNNRNLRMERQTPNLSPSDIDKIKSIYSEAREASLVTGIAHHVDHVCPIAKGGAHHWLNMAIVPAKSNLEKGAKWNGIDGFTYAQLS